MHILITNDDGFDAIGIRYLINSVCDLGDITVVAPEKNHSGASSALTLIGEITVRRVADNRFRVGGTPTDCVHLALTGNFLLSKPDLIVSGINNGANLGDDTIYSGTVAATIEGHLFDVPGMAFSMAGKSEQHYAAGATVARRLVSLFQQKALSGLPLLNVNIPDAPENNIADIMTTRLGRRHAAEPSILLNRDEHTMLYTIGEAGKARDNSIGTDFHAIENGAVSVTPLMVDLTDSAQLGRVWEWLQS